MADSNTPVKPREPVIPTNATSLTNISQEAMLEIIGMKAVNSDKDEIESNASAKKDTTSHAHAEITKKDENDTVPAKEEAEDSSEVEKVSCSTLLVKEAIAASGCDQISKSDTVKSEEAKTADGSAKIGKSEKDKIRSRCSTPAPGREDTNSTDASGRTSKELKSILQLSKEARLDTNIGHKRKSMDVSKPNERLEQSEKSSSEERGESKH